MKVKKDAGGDANDSDTDTEDPVSLIPDDEVQLIDEFLTCFTIEGSAKEGMIDIKHVMKAFPGRIDEYNVFRCRGSINFDITAQGLISFKFDESDELFKYFDDKNKTRLNKLMKKTENTEKTTEELVDTTGEILEVLQEVKKRGKIK